MYDIREGHIKTIQFFQYQVPFRDFVTRRCYLMGYSTVYVGVDGFHGTGTDWDL